MKIALVAPPFGPTGGPEIVVQNLAQGLTKRGVDVTLFAPADWPDLRCPHVSTLSQSLWNMDDFSKQDDLVRRNYIYASQTVVLRHISDFDLIHLHSYRSAYAVAAASPVPCVVTIHSKPESSLFEQLRQSGCITVGLTQSQIAGLTVDAVIGNGIPLQSITPSYEEGEYLLAVGRLHEQKGIHQAIDIAKRAQKKLVIIGRIGVSDDRQGYYQKFIEPYIDGKRVVLIESVPHEGMYERFRRASFLLFPITFPESNPLVVMEALACGTPVLGTRVAPLTEMLPDQNSAAFLLSDDIDELANAALHPERFDRKACRAYAEKHFDVSVMSEKYLDLYQKVLASHSARL